METGLVLSRGGFPSFSARGCTQQLIPQHQGDYRRTIDGRLIYLGSSEKKYKTIIDCEDKTSMATASLMPGESVIVDCIQTLWQTIEHDLDSDLRIENVTREIMLSRPVVEGSVMVFNVKQEKIPYEQKDSQCVRVSHDARWVCFRPRLKMNVTAYYLKTDEWGGRCGWRLEMEEV